MLEATLLGQFAVRLEGRPVEINSRPAELLLSYLLLTAGSRHRREKLAALLWPDADEEKGRQNLRNALWKLNKALGKGYVAADKATVALDGEAAWRVDAHAVAVARNGAVDALKEAVEAYQGELLPGYYDEWVLLERERLEAASERNIQALLDALIQNKRWAEVIELAERWISYGQVPEPAYRALMDAHAALGDAAAMVGAYRRCKEDLSEQLGLGPSPETVELYRRHARSGAPAEAPSGNADSPASRELGSMGLPRFLTDAVVPPGSGRDAFVGRQEELCRLDAALGRALGGTFQILFVSGEAGRGKTSLLREFVRHAVNRRADIAAASGSCDAFAGPGDPFLPFRDILAMFTGNFETHWRAGALEREHALRLWRLIPDALEALERAGSVPLSALLPGGASLEPAAWTGQDGLTGTSRQALLRPTAGVQTQGADRFGLLDAYADFLMLLSTKHPLVLVLDDLHWADVPSLDLLFHLARRVAGAPIFCVGAFRPEDLARGRDGQAHPLQSLLSELERLYGDIVLDLDLTAESAASAREFVDALLDAEPNQLSGEFRQEFASHTDGHPLFAVELLHDFKQRGGLVRDDAGRWRASKALDWDNTPARIGGIVQVRLGHLDSYLREALTIASIEGEEFTAELVARIQGIEARDLVVRLSRDADRRHRLVQEQGMIRRGQHRLSRFRFRHHMFQKYLYAALGPADRAYLHEAVGRTLEELHGDAVDDIAVQLARHYREAGWQDREIHYLLKAGQRALNVSAADEAASHLKAALSVLATLPMTEERRESEVALLLALGSALQASLGYAAEEVGAVYARARERCRTSGNLRQRFQGSWNLWAYQMQHAQVRTARKVAEELLALAGESADDGLLLQAHHTLWFTMLCTGRFAEARDHATQGIRLYERGRHHTYAMDFGGHDPGVCARLFLARAVWHLGSPDEALAHADYALELAKQIGHVHTLVHAYVFAAETRILRREGAEAKRLAELAHEHAVRHQLAHWTAWSTILLGCAMAEDGQLSGGIQAIEEGIASYRSIGGALEMPVFLGRLAAAYLQHGSSAKGMQAVAEAARLARRTGEHRYDPELLRVRGELLVRQGRYVEGEECVRAALASARRLGASAFELRAAISLGQLLPNDPNAITSLQKARRGARGGT